MRRFLTLVALAGLCIPFWNSAAAADSPAAKIKVLIITGDDVDVHPWKETTAAVRKILEDSGRFDVQVSEDLKPLESTSALGAYDVLILNRYNRTAPLSDAGKKILLDFVRGGKGIFVQHLASASFPKWKEFGKLCGRYWVMGTSGHGKRSVFAAEITNDEHPITEGLKGFKADDELYAKLQGSGPINVLIEAKSDWSGNSEPLLFWLPYGQGHVVHSAFGHDTKAIATPEVTTVILRGVEWAATGKVAK